MAMALAAALRRIAAYVAGRAKTGNKEEETPVEHERQEAEDAKQREDEAWDIIQGYNSRIAYAPKEPGIGTGSEDG